MEDPGREGFLLSVAQEVYRAGRQDDFPSASVGLGIPGHQPAALFTMKGTIYFQGAAVAIEVRPHEAADLTPAQAGGQLGIEEIIPDRILPDHINESIQLFLIQNFHGLADHLGRVYLIGGIGGDQPLIFGSLECMMKGGVDAVNGIAGETMLLAGTGFHPAISFQGIIELP